MDVSFTIKIISFSFSEFNALKLLSELEIDIKNKKNFNKNGT